METEDQNTLLFLQHLVTMSLAILARPTCRSCQYGLLQSFAAIAGISLPPLSRPQSKILAPGHNQRWYTRSQVKSFERSPKAFQAPAADGEDEHPSEPQADMAPSQSTPIPWYLQVETPQPPAPAHPLAERQFIPELPPNPPPILSPILQYLSVDSGLDNLSLIDLRHLDPPPALGANLIMMIGTARSVKHLNVSADRFCRWLRSNYKMRPYADGLLGRNELKLKLRRKARRLKLAQSVGNTLEAGRDDGITTGWICVNLGSVEDVGDEVSAGEDENLDGAGLRDGEQIQEAESTDDGYVGFGSRSTAPRIVVQMFTEEKRAEMDLEGLWDVRRSRRATKDQKGEEALENADANGSSEEPFAMQRTQIDLEGDFTASRGGYSPEPSYASSAN